jgi:hypothetical protein
MAAERGAMGHVEGTLPGLGESGAGGGYDNGISHFVFSGILVGLRSGIR